MILKYDELEDYLIAGTIIETQDLGDEIKIKVMKYGKIHTLFIKKNSIEYLED